MSPRSERVRAAALVLTLAFLLGPGSAAAQTGRMPICTNTPTATQVIACSQNSLSSSQDVDINAQDVIITVPMTNILNSVYASQSGLGAIRINLRSPDINMQGGSSGVYGFIANTANEKTISIDVTGGTIDSSGTGSGVSAYHDGSGAIRIDLRSLDITMRGGSGGVGVSHVGLGEFGIELRNVDITTMGGSAHGVRGSARMNSMNEKMVSIRATGGTIETAGAGASGILLIHEGLGAGEIDLRNLDITTAGRSAYGVRGFLSNGQNGETLSIRATGGTITAKRYTGISGAHGGRGSVSMTTGAGLTVKAPFSVGVEGHLTNAENAAGRILVTHEGAVEARDVGLLAWARRSGGHTFGDGAQTADDAARTAPMIHVTSSGDITVGTSVMDAFIREVVAGTDGTLSTAENAVLSAVTAEDSDALETALGALPADYDDDYKTEARDLLSSRRGTMPPPAEEQARQVAEEILEIPRAGIRALALEHVAVTNHVRNGDGDGILSATEQTVLEAVLKGSGLETALGALSNTYTDAWKDEVRQHAASYNAGDIRVDVTGGTITSDGDGVYARYVLTHDRNGAIAVTVAEGASVTGGRSGLYVGGAGAGEGTSRKQRVTVNGEVMGGTGAGVHVAGGGELDVGRTGRIGASSGVGVLADGMGDFQATVAGTVMGDIRGTGAGTMTATVLEGGTVTGTVRLPRGTVTVGGTAGRLLFANGGTATVAPTGRITGVAGAAEAIRSEAGDLAVTVAGTVQGNVLALGDGDLTARVMGTVDGDIRTMGAGTLTLAVPEGGVVTGTVHDPVGPLTVAGSIGRLLYANGGTATVARTGRITGVSGEAIRSEAGDLAVTVAGMVQGDVRALGDGDLTAEVTGTVNGDVEGLGDGDHTVAVPVGGWITGTVLLDGSTVTVGGTVGRITLNDGGTVRIASTGQVTGVSGGRHGVSVGPGGTIENHGTITGTIGIEAGAGSTVVNSGTVRSTNGAQGIAMNFQPGENTLTLRRGTTIIGRIQGLGPADTVNLSDVAADELGLLTFVDENEMPVTPDIEPPRAGGVGRLIRAGHTLVGLDTTAFALTDDVLSDLTGSIHAAVLGTGMPAQAHEGAPAQGHVWATPFGGWREQTGTGSLADGTHTFGGGLVGAGWGTQALHVGGFIGGSAGQLAVAGSRQNVDMQTVFGGAYAQQALEDVRLDARVLVGHVAHDATRRVNPGTAHAAYTAFLFSPEVGVALRVPVMPTLHAMPRLRVRYAGLFTEGFRERAPGGNWDVGFAARSVQILEGRGEVSLPIAIENGGHVAPRLGLEGRWLLAGEMVEGTLPGGSFQTSAGGDQAVATGTLGLGLRLPVAAGATLVGNFDGALTTEHAWRATGYLGLTYSF